MICLEASVFYIINQTVNKRNYKPDLISINQIFYINKSCKSYVCVINAFLYNDCGCPNVSSLQEVDTLDDSDTAADRTSDTTDINNKQNDPPRAMMADLLTDKDLFDSID